MNHITNPSTLDQPKLFIAGMGAITPVGDNLPMTFAAVNASYSAYSVSEHINQHGQPISTAWVPDRVLNEIEAEIGTGDRFNLQHDRVIKMAIIAIREACEQHAIIQPVPLVLAMPDVYVDLDRLTPLVQNLEHNCRPWISTDFSRSIYSGRAAGIEAIEFAFRYLYDLPNDFILIGGSDSYQDSARLDPLDNSNRLKVEGSTDSFVPGEAASFLLLTRHPELALMRNSQVIALNPPGIADEPGHINSHKPYHGEGLEQAFKKALINQSPNSIYNVYTSMNGEHYWAKEYCVALARSRHAFQEEIRFERPADCYGDAGSATAPLLIALAAEHLWKNRKANAHLVYSSSDTAKRGALVVEKIGPAPTKVVTPSQVNPPFSH